ncbi:MAG TPA: hypothetical protein VHO07_28160, partial [Streptosporangiaceae bacterium]|nr:hypothetical protein [Streptosporangiaceae bacterium]
LRSAQEPSGRAGDTGPGVVFIRRVPTGERLVTGIRALVLRHGRGRDVRLSGVRCRVVRLRGVRLWGARDRDDQARWNGPGRHETCRFTPAERALGRRFFWQRGTLVTILTRLVALCIHHRPQFTHFRQVPQGVDIYTN